MRIPEEVLDVVSFLVTKDQREDEIDKVCRGTAFFVSIPSPNNPNRCFPYLVTAKHNVAKAREQDLEVYLRLNNIHDRSEDILINTEWTVPDDPSVDIAVLPFSPPQERFRYRAVAHTMLPDENRLRELNVGIGDEVVVSGLFTRRTGKAKNLPIVRFGNIAAMPSELLSDSKTGLDFQAYLIEFRSIGGWSGSPVFVYIGPERVDPSGNRAKLTFAALFLIGVVRSHWQHNEPIPYVSAFADEIGNVNWGIGAVTPTTELIRILYSEKFVKQRDAIDRKCLQADDPTDGSTQEKFSSFYKTKF